MCDQILCDLFAPIFIKNILSRKPDSIDHSLCAYDKIRVSDSFLTLLRQSLRASHADSEKCDLLFSGKSVAFDQHMPAFPQRQTLFCERSSDDHNSCTTGFGRLDLLKKAAGFAGILGNQISALILRKHRPIHFHGKRSLHRNQVPAFKTKCLTGFDHGRKGQHSCKQALLIIQNGGKCRQFLASCGQENIPCSSFQVLCRCLCILNIDSVLLSAACTEDPRIRDFGFLAGFSDISCHFCCVRMCRIQNKFRFFSGKKLFHLILVETSRLYMQTGTLFEGSGTIFCRHACQHRDLVFTEETTDLVSFGRPGKYNDFIHSCILVVLPSCR